MRMKLTKLAKRLSTFTFEDFMVMSNEEEDTVKAFLNAMISEEKINKIDENNYRYNGNGHKFKSKDLVINSIKKHTYFTKEEIMEIDRERNSLDSFKNAPKSVQKMINKYVDLLIEMNNTPGRMLENYIHNDWNKNNPDKATTKSAFLRAKNILKKFGVAGLIAPNRRFLTTNSQLDEELYQKFREYIFKNKNKSLKFNYVKFRAEYLQKNPEEEKWEFPSYNSVTTRIQRDILKFKDSKLAKIFDEKKIVRIIQKKYGFKTFQPAAEDFLKDLLEKNELKKQTFLLYQRIATLHLIPFFKNIKLNEINAKKMSEYDCLMQERQYASNKITCHINLLKKILRIYLNDSCKPSDTREIYAEFDNKINILEKTQIQHLLNTSKKYFPDFYPLLVTAMNTGMTRGEILALTWDKVDFENNKLKVNKSIHNGNIIGIRTKQANREIDLPDKIVEILAKIKEIQCSEYIFPDKKGTFQNPEEMNYNSFKPLIKKAGYKNIKFIDLRDTYTTFLIEENLPLSYIKDQLGFSNLNTLADKYKKFIPQKKKNFCLI